MKTYQETLDFLFSQLPMYQREGVAAIKKDLTNSVKLCDHLGDPQNAYPTIHIAGTNGKGTVSHLIAAVLQASGYKVGLYTSPHYRDFRERIKVDGHYISEEQVTQFVKENKEFIQEVKPSFFEITVSMAFDYFKQEGVDFAVIETGLGGRLDSTNIIDPLVSVITHISSDHQAMLGPDIYSIAFEKAGIIKAKRPVVIGRYQPSCDQVFYKMAEERGAPISFASLQWEVTAAEGKYDFYNWVSKESIRITTTNQSPFIVENMVTTIETFEVLNRHCGVILNLAHLIEGIENFQLLTNYIGRWQIINKTPMIIADSAHNEDALQKVIKRISEMNYERVHFVIGFVNDKVLSKILPLFPAAGRYYFVKPDIPRGMETEELINIATSYNLKGEAYTSVNKGLHAAKEAAHANDLIYVGGSSFVVAEVV